MFKKNLLVVFVLLVGVLFFGSQAGAVPFTVKGVDDGVVFGGLAFGDYDVHGEPVYLNSDADFNTPQELFEITFTETSAGIGTVNATIDLIDPPDKEPETQDGFYAGLSVVGDVDFTMGFIIWGEPVFWDVGYGILYLDLVDIYALCCDTICDNTITISGIFNFEPNPVPEPATMFLLGTGLIGLGTISRKKLIKK